MKKIGLMLASAALTSCVSVADIRAKPPYYSGTSEKSVNSVAACVATALQVGPGVLVSTVPLENGTSIVQSAHVPQGITPFVIVDIVTKQNSTAVDIRANGRQPKNVGKNFSVVIACL